MRRHLYFYTLVEGDFGAVAELFHDDPAMWLPAPAQSRDDGYVVQLTAEGALPRPFASHDVVVSLGRAGEGGARLLRTITWRSATAAGIFPVFDGDIELAALQGGGCQLSLMGTYRPPLSVAGTAADALLGHHVAEACVRRFVLDAAAAMSGATLLA